ncbi:hypothetical protein NMY22_g3002 [Coprinellus aureogranulatus]|nr:hypothetical protein NMY22_g3002 [Coprinellus aureogranulatus]
MKKVPSDLRTDQVYLGEPGSRSSGVELLSRRCLSRLLRIGVMNARAPFTDVAFSRFVRLPFRLTLHLLTPWGHPFTRPFSSLLPHHKIRTNHAALPRESRTVALEIHPLLIRLPGERMVYRDGTLISISGGVSHGHGSKDESTFALPPIFFPPYLFPGLPTFSIEGRVGFATEFSKTRSAAIKVCVHRGEFHPTTVHLPAPTLAFEILDTNWAGYQSRGHDQLRKTSGKSNVRESRIAGIFVPRVIRYANAFISGPSTFTQADRNDIRFGFALIDNAVRWVDLERPHPSSHEAVPSECELTVRPSVQPLDRGNVYVK